MIRAVRLSPFARIVSRIAAAGAVAGAVYSHFVHDDFVTGLVIGAVNGAALPWLEMALRGPGGGLLRRLPFAGAVVLRSALYLVVIVVINLIAVPLLNSRAPLGGLQPRDIVFAAAASFVGNLILAVGDLLGLDVLIAFVAGRYHRPRVEERALLFVDLRASTTTAERLGGTRFLDFLNAVFADLSAAITENGGEIHKYVGDEIIATWRLAPGPNEPNIVRAWAAGRARLTARAEIYRREFGLAPDFRAALHAGDVVVGELGSRRKEIALIGDPMNTAARMLDACRELDRPALASTALFSRLDRLPASIEAKPIAPLPLRGKSEPLELFALEARAAAAPANVLVRTE